jgi:hypothetical protein
VFADHGYALVERERESRKRHRRYNPTSRHDRDSFPAF